MLEPNEENVTTEINPQETPIEETEKEESFETGDKQKKFDINEMKDKAKQFSDETKQKLENQLYHFEQIFPSFRRRNDRSKRYKTLLDVVPVWSLFSIFVFLSMVLIIFLLIGMFAAPPSRLVVQNKVPFSEGIYDNFEPVVATLENLSPNNLELFFSFYFQYNNTYIDVEKKDLSLQVIYETRPGPNANWTIVNGLNDIRSRNLYCSKGYNYNVWKGDFSFVFTSCNKVILVHEKVKAYAYRISFILLNAKKLYQQKAIQGDIITEFEYTNADFTIFEIVIRSVFAGISILFAVVYPIVSFKQQQFTKFHTHQKWMIPLLFFHIFYHDPIYWASVFIGFGYFFQIFNTFMSLTFIYIFLLYLLIFLHSLFVKVEDRRFFKFYLFKIVLVLILWVLSLIVVIWSMVFDPANPFGLEVTELPGYIYFELTVIAFIVLYVFYILYFVIRAIINLRKLPKKYSSRFKVVVSLSIFVLISFTSVVILEGRTKFTAPGFSFLLSHLIVLVYFCFLGFFFLPSSIEDDEGVVKEMPIDETNNGEITLNEEQIEEKTEFLETKEPTVAPYNPDEQEEEQVVN